MEKNTNENEGGDIGVRVVLTKDYDQPLYDYFLLIKNNLGIKNNTEVVRICIKKAYEYWFSKGKEFDKK